MRIWAVASRGIRAPLGGDITPETGVCQAWRQELRGWPVSRILSTPDRDPGLDDHSSGPVVTHRIKLPTRTSGQKRPGGDIQTDQPAMTSLFGIAPGGACHARTVTSPPVGSYPTFSPSPCKQGSLFSVALSLGLPRPGVTRRRFFLESGLSSHPLAGTRDHPAIRASRLYAPPIVRSTGNRLARPAINAQSTASSGPLTPGRKRNRKAARTTANGKFPLAS